MDINIFGLITVLSMLFCDLVLFIPKKSRGVIRRTFKSKTHKYIWYVGRFGAFVFMFWELPNFMFGWSSVLSLLSYIALNTFLIILYCILRAISAIKQNWKNQALSLIPSAVLIFDGLSTNYLPLIIFSLIFAFSDITAFKKK